MKNKLIIHLKKPVIKLPDAKSEFSLNSIEVSDASLKKTLGELDILTIRRTVPTFKLENHTKSNQNNEFFQISDMSLIYTISFKTNFSKIKEHKNALSKLDNIKMVEFVYQYENTDETVIPNDDHFKYTDNNSNGVYDFGTDTPGRQWGLFDYYVSNPQNRADVSMPEAWDYSTGSSNIKIGFVESTSAAYAGDPTNGITELKGRNSGDYGFSWGDNSHALATAGIAVANTNNEHLVAGVDWNAKYYSAAHNSDSEQFASAIQSCIDENCNIINNSWSIEAGDDGSSSTMLAIRNAYLSGLLVVAAMGNNRGSQDRAPACYSDIVFSVASTDKSNNYSEFSNHNYYVDVTAPGGTNSGSQYDDICVITGDDDVDYVYGTSFSTPLVSGVASLMMSKGEDVRAEDVEYILKHTADDIEDPGFDEYTGWGKINAKEAIRRLSSEYNMERHTTSGGTVIQVDYSWKTFVLYANFYTCAAKKYRIEKNVSFDSYYQGTPLVWGNIDGTLGVPPSNPNYQIPWCGAKEGTITSSGATLQTFVYKCKDIFTGETFWYPCAPTEVEFAYTVLGVEGTPPPLTVSISGPTSLGYNEQGTFTANPSGGKTPYTNYRWWERKDEGGLVPESVDGVSTILAPPPGEWIYVSSWEGQQTVQVARTYDFSLKCEVTDSDNNTATDIHSVIVGGGLAKTQGTVDETSGLAIPEGVELTGNFPNPFNPSTSIRFGLPEDVHLQLTIYSITGQKVISLADGYYSPGYYDIKWNGRNASGNLVSNGIYVYELRTGNQRLIKKMVFAK